MISLYNWRLSRRYVSGNILSGGWVQDEVLDMAKDATDTLIVESMDYYYILLKEDRPND